MEPEIKLGNRVKVLGKNAKGEVAFIGDTHFSEGTWYGIILDDPKGRHNGAVDGIRYFKCSRNHGIFVRACQVETEWEDDANGKRNNSGRIKYPNYLKSSGKLVEKQLYESKCTEVVKTNSQLKILDQEILEDNVPRVAKRSPKVQAFKGKNQELKDKLKTTEQSLQEILLKYNKALEEIKHLKDDIECKKRQINVQKCHLKLLKMKQCHHFKKVDPYELLNTNSNQSNKGESTAKISNLSKEEINTSDDEFNMESIKALTSMQRIVELEEQNRIMIEGLVELRDFLKTKCQPHFKDSYSTETQSHLKGKGGDARTFSESKGKSDNFTIPESNVKDYTEMLRKMMKYSEKKKKRKRLDKLNQTQTSRMESPENFDTVHAKHTSNTNNHEILQSSGNLNQPNTNNKYCLKTSGVEPNVEIFQNSLISNGKLQNYLQEGNYQSSRKLSKMTVQISSSMNNNDETVSLNSARPVTEFKQLMSTSTMVSNSEDDTCYTNMSLIQQEYLMNDLPESTSNSSLYNSEPNSGLVPIHGKEIAVISGGDNALVLPKRKKSKGRLKVSSRMY